MAGKRPGVDSSDAICSGLVDIMWLIGNSLYLDRPQADDVDPVCPIRN